MPMNVKPIATLDPRVNEIRELTARIVNRDILPNERILGAGWKHGASDEERATSKQVADTIKDKVKAGTSIFLIVKRAGADGNPSGPPLAVDKLTWADGGVPFELTDEQAMVANTELSGDVIVMARYDQDADALSKEPGDVTGQARVKIPAVNVKLSLDTLIQ